MHTRGLDVWTSLNNEGTKFIYKREYVKGEKDANGRPVVKSQKEKKKKSRNSTTLEKQANVN